MTTLTPEKEAELRELSPIAAPTSQGWRAHLTDLADLLAALSTERQARERAEVERDKLSAKCEEALSLLADRSTQLDWMTSAHSAAEAENDGLSAKLAALAEAAQAVSSATRQNSSGEWIIEGDGEVLSCNLAEALSALPPPVPTEEGGELKWTPFSTMEPEPGGDRDLAIKRLEKAKNIQQTDVARGLALVTRSDLIDMFHQWWWTIGVARHFKEKADQLSALRPSPISHEDRPLVLAPSDNNHKALVEAKDGWLPIVLAPTDGQWRYVRLPDGSEAVAAFEGDALGPRARRWRTKAFAYHNPSRPSGEARGGVEQFTQAYDTFVISDLPDGVYPTHFRPNDTVYGSAETQALAAFQSRQEGKQP